MEDFRLANPKYNRGLLSFAVGFIVQETWPRNTLMSDYNKCEADCATGGGIKVGDCGCTCTTDPDDWSDEQVAVGHSFPMPRHRSGSRFKLSAQLRVELRVKMLVHADLYA